MAAVTPQMVKQLRDRTDQPMGLCKQALDQNAGDMEKAIEWLRQQNAKMGVKREGSETAEGRIGVFFDNAAKKAAIVEMRCESAPSAKQDRFIARQRPGPRRWERASRDALSCSLRPSAEGNSPRPEQRGRAIREKMIVPNSSA